MKKSASKSPTTCRTTKMMSALSTFALLAITALTSCSAVKNVQIPQMVDQSYMVNGQMVHDSIYLRDSIYIREYSRNDTVYIDRWRERIQDHEVVRTDTLKVTEYQTITETQKYIPRFYKWCTVLFWLVIVCVIVYVSLRILKAVYLRK